MSAGPQAVRRSRPAGAGDRSAGSKPCAEQEQGRRCCAPPPRAVRRERSAAPGSMCGSDRRADAKSISVRDGAPQHGSSAATSRRIADSGSGTSSSQARSRRWWTKFDSVPPGRSSSSASCTRTSRFGRMGSARAVIPAGRWPAPRPPRPSPPRAARLTMEPDAGADLEAKKAAGNADRLQLAGSTRIERLPPAAPSAGAGTAPRVVEGVCPA